MQKCYWTYCRKCSAMPAPLFSKKAVWMKRLCLTGKTGSSPTVWDFFFFFCMIGLWQLKAAAVFHYGDDYMVETKCTKQKHQLSTISIIIFVVFCGVLPYTPFSPANLKRANCTVHYMVLKWLKLHWLYTLNRKWDRMKESRKKKITYYNTILGLMPAVSHWKYTEAEFLGYCLGIVFFGILNRTLKW